MKLDEDRQGKPGYCRWLQPRDESNNSSGLQQHIFKMWLKPCFLVLHTFRQLKQTEIKTKNELKIEKDI